MKTTLILNPNIKSYDQLQTFWESFATFNFVILFLAAQIAKSKVTSNSAGAVAIYNAIYNGRLHTSLQRKLKETN